MLVLIYYQSFLIANDLQYFTDQYEEFTWLNEIQLNMLSGFKNKLETFQLLVDLKKKK